MNHKENLHKLNVFGVSTRLGNMCRAYFSHRFTLSWAKNLKKELAIKVHREWENIVKQQVPRERALDKGSEHEIMEMNAWEKEVFSSDLVFFFLGKSETKLHRCPFPRSGIIDVPLLRSANCLCRVSSTVGDCFSVYLFKMRLFPVFEGKTETRHDTHTLLDLRMCHKPYQQLDNIMLINVACLVFHWGEAKRFVETSALNPTRLMTLS